jgi:hypothetical protein
MPIGTAVLNATVLVLKNAIEKKKLRGKIKKNTPQSGGLRGQGSCLQEVLKKVSQTCLSQQVVDDHRISVCSVKINVDARKI